MHIRHCIRKMSEAEVTPNKRIKQNVSASECSLIVELVEKDLEVMRGNILTSLQMQESKNFGNK